MNIAVLAIVPALNEAGRVGRVVQALVTQGVPVLVVDDGSSDETTAEAEGAGARVLQLQPNRGKGGALKAGFREALVAGDATWDAFLTMDGDGQHDPAHVPGCPSAPSTARRRATSGCGRTSPASCA